MMVDVSVIIPAHNRLWALPESVESCRGTTCRTEIIVVDDGSDDGTWEWLQEQPDVVAMRSHRWGKPWAVNKAFKYAQGKYVRFLDSDDWLPDGVIDGQFQMAEESCADLVVAGQMIFRDGGLEETRQWTYCDDFIAQQLGECDSSHYSAFLFRRDFIEDIPHRTAFGAADFASRDDRCFMIEVALAEPHYVVYPEPGLCHRHHSTDRLQFAQGLRDVGTNIQHLLIYRQALGILADRGELTERRKKAAIKVLWPLAHWIARTHPREGEEVAAWVHELDPTFSPPEKGALSLMYARLGFRWTERVLAARRRMIGPFRRRSNQYRSLGLLTKPTER